MLCLGRAQSAHSECDETVLVSTQDECLYGEGSDVGEGCREWRVLSVRDDPGFTREARSKARSTTLCFLEISTFPYSSLIDSCFRPFYVTDDLKVGISDDPLIYLCPVVTVAPRRGMCVWGQWTSRPGNTLESLDPPRRTTREVSPPLTPTCCLGRFRFG